MHKLFVSILLLITCFSTYSQVKISGKITNVKNEIYPDVTLTLQTANGTTILAYDYPNDDGMYTLEYKGGSDSLIVSVSGFNILKQSVNVSRTTTTVNFKVVEKEMELKEVIVKSKKIWGEKDTVNYLVSGFKSGNDQVIGDVLRKMPGITVKESGEISYNGKPINKFYIENLDLLQGRYGIATNNIQAADVATVQVLEHHQPIKALDNNSTMANETAINLKLKEGSKGTFGLLAQLGIGAQPLLWENELTGLFFGKKYQNISVYKGNNSGRNITNELNSFSASRGITEEPLLAVKMPSAPSINENRYLFNNTNTVSVNQLFKNTDEKQLNFSLNYVNDFETKNAYSRSEYFLSNDSIITVSENANATQNTDRVTAALLLNKNTKTVYMNNVSEIEYGWQKSGGSIDNQQQLFGQQLEQKNINIQNSLHYVKVKENGKSFIVNSHQQFSSSPQRMHITPLLLLSGYSDGDVFQDAQVNELNSENSCSLLSMKLGTVVLKVDGQFDLTYKSLTTDVEQESGLSALPVLSPDSTVTQLTSLKTVSGIYPLFSFLRSSFKLYWGVPAYYVYLDIQNSENKPDPAHRIHLNPFVNLFCKLGFNSELSLSYNFNNGYGALSDASTAYYFTDYMTMKHNRGVVSENHEHKLSAVWQYKDVLKMFFGNIALYYSENNKNTLQNISFREGMMLYEVLPYNNSPRQLSATTQLSKGFDFMKTVVALKAGYSNYSAEQASQGNMNAFVQSNFNVELKSSLSVSKAMGLEYKLLWNDTKVTVNNTGYNNEINTLNHQLTLRCDIARNFYLTTSAEHYYLSAINNSSQKNKFFADIHFNYTLKSAFLSLGYTNILNTDEYIYSSFDGINSYYNNYKIRPACLLFKIKFKLI